MAPADERLAEALGAHAVGWFLAALALLLPLTALLWALARRLTVRSERSRLSPTIFLLSRLGLGFAVIVGAAAVFAEMLEGMDADDEIGRFDSALARTLNARLPAGALRAFGAFTHLGDPAVLTGLGVVVAVWLAWRGQRGLALGWVAALAGNGVLNRALKEVFERVRPPHAQGVAPVLGYSFPSGHSSGSVVAYGLLAYVLVRTLPARWHLPSVLAASAVAFTTGSSRVLLQVHYASDVLAGFASGLAWLTVCVMAIEWLRHARLERDGRVPPAAADRR